MPALEQWSLCEHVFPSWEKVQTDQRPHRQAHTHTHMQFKRSVGTHKHALRYTHTPHHTHTHRKEGRKEGRKEENCQALSEAGHTYSVTDYSHIIAGTGFVLVVCEGVNGLTQG